MPRVPKAKSSRPSQSGGVKVEEDLQQDILQTQKHPLRIVARTFKAKSEGDEGHIRPECPECGRSLNRKADLLRHQKQHNPEAHRIHCPYCSHSTLQQSNMDTHIRSRHTGEGIVCNKCGVYEHTDKAMISRHRKKNCVGMKREDHQLATIPIAVAATVSPAKRPRRNARPTAVATSAFDVAGCSTGNIPFTPPRRSARLKPKIETPSTPSGQTAILPTTPVRRSDRLNVSPRDTPPKPPTATVPTVVLPVTPRRSVRLRSGARRSPGSSAKAAILLTKPATALPSSPLRRSPKKHAGSATRSSPHTDKTGPENPPLAQSENALKVYQTPATPPSSPATATTAARVRTEPLSPSSGRMLGGLSSAEFDPFHIDAELEDVIMARIAERGYDPYSDHEDSGSQPLFLTVSDNARSDLVQANLDLNEFGPRYMTDLELGINPENLKYYHDEDKALLMPVLHDGVGPLPACSYN